jgi:high affinity Mn2+ porin
MDMAALLNLPTVRALLALRVFAPRNLAGLGNGASIRVLFGCGLFVVFAGATLAPTRDAVAAAVEPEDATAPPTSEERFAIHGQFTLVEQDVSGFNAPYAGPNSLTPDRGKETTDLTLFFGARLWRGAELWITPEIDQGFGLDNTLGVAGFPSGEAYKVGSHSPYLRWPRAFVRQVVDLGDEREPLEGVANQLRGSRALDRWVFTVGKFGVTDIFDTNQYANTPRNDFLNWSAVNSGSFDYAADAWGFTVGAAAERYMGSWTVRVGIFDLSNVPNSIHLDPGFHEFQMVAEVEKRYALFGQTGRVRITAYDSRGRMGLLDQAIALGEATGTTPDPALVRQYRGRLGASLNLEQPITSDLGVFARYGKAQGNVEAYEFTDIDRALEMGASLKGNPWLRPGDTLGLAYLDNGISALREQFLNDGGLGILIGDGKLPHPAAEQIIESYYSINLISQVFISLDYQWVKNPGYNTDRGPVSIYAVRFHAQF